MESLKGWTELFSGFGGNGMEDIGATAFLALMALSLVCSFFIVALYLYFYQNRATGSQIHRCFPLMGISVSAIFICIQFSLPLSLGLLGALSIVRFRTPIKEPEEIGFILLLIAVSIACATFNLIFVAILLTLAVTALTFQKMGPRFLGDRVNDGMILVTLDDAKFEEKRDAVVQLLSNELKQGKIESIHRNQNQSTLSYSFLRMDKTRLATLQTQLKDLIGSAFHIYFNRASA